MNTRLFHNRRFQIIREKCLATKSFLEGLSLFILSMSLVIGLMLVPHVEAFAQTKTPPAMKLGDPMPINLFVELGKIINPSVVNIQPRRLAEAELSGIP